MSDAHIRNGVVSDIPSIYCAYTLTPATMQKFLTAALLCIPITASAKQIQYSYTTQTEPQAAYGFGKAETYDVAIRINDASLAGTKVTALSVPILGSENIIDPKVWISTDLILKKVSGKYVNSPDIAEYSATITDGQLSCQLPEAYTLSGPVYIGYSFTTTSGTDESGIPVVVQGYADENGLFLHSSKTKLKWGSASEAAGGVSAMTLTLEGTFSDNSASFQPVDQLFASAENECRAALRLVNHGFSPINSIEYAIDGTDDCRTLTLPTPLDGAIGAWRDVEIMLPKYENVGKQTQTISIVKVNGQPNGDIAPNTETSIRVLPFIPAARPLVEEYTGLWCGYCPRGYVALETMKEREPERFVALAYHSDDPMMMPNAASNNVPDGLPAAYINQGASINPAKIYTDWYKFASVMPCADIRAEVEWTDATQSAIKVTSTTRFIDDSGRNRYAISYVLVADGLSDSTWQQSNYFSGHEQTDEMPGHWGRLFCEGPDHITGLIFNDVVLMQLQPEGYDGSVPETYTAGQELKHSVTLKLADINSGDLSIVQDKNNLRVVAILLDKSTGRPVNSCTSPYTDGHSNESGLTDVSQQPCHVQWYDLQGHPHANPQQGLNIRVSRYPDGRTVAEKILY